MNRICTRHIFVFSSNFWMRIDNASKPIQILQVLLESFAVALNHSIIISIAVSFLLVLELQISYHFTQNKVNK